MKDIYKSLFWIVVIVLIIVIVKKTQTANASSGGILDGKLHKDGGIPVHIITNNKDVVVEGGEDVLTRNVNNIKEKYRCEGTPQGIASAINVLAGGVSFDNNGKCVKI